MNMWLSRRGRRQQRFDVPAVVLGAGINGLGVVRSLARCGVPTWLVDNDLRSPEARTRFGRKLRTPAMGGPELVERLVEISEQYFPGVRPLLFLTQEKGVRTLSEARDAIKPHYRLTLPDPERLSELTHKYGFYRLAAEAGAPVPVTVQLREAADLDRISHVPFPAVLKPAHHYVGLDKRLQKAYRVANEHEVIALFHELSSVLPDLVLQQWLKGEDADIFFCLQYVGEDGQTVASFSGRKIRSWPPAVGGTASCTAAPEAHAELDRLTTDFFRAVGFRGMGSMEYKLDRSSNQFLMVEPTVGRTDFQEEVATLNGVNIPFAAYCYELGLSVQTVINPVAPIVWRHATVDRWSARLQEQSLKDGLPSGAVVVDALWRSGDLLPGLFSAGVQFGRAGGLRSRFFRKTSKAE